MRTPSGSSPVSEKRVGRSASTTLTAPRCGSRGATAPSRVQAQRVDAERLLAPRRSQCPPPGSLPGYQCSVRSQRRPEPPPSNQLSHATTTPPDRSMVRGTQPVQPALQFVDRKREADGVGRDHPPHQSGSRSMTSSSRRIACAAPLTVTGDEERTALGKVGNEVLESAPHVAEREIERAPRARGERRGRRTASPAGSAAPRSGTRR